MDEKLVLHKMREQIEAIKAENAPVTENQLILMDIETPFIAGEVLITGSNHFGNESPH